MPPRAEFSPMTPLSPVLKTDISVCDTSCFPLLSFYAIFWLTGYFLHADSAAERRFLLQLDYASA
jgi:hypothetical protein